MTLVKLLKMDPKDPSVKCVIDDILPVEDENKKFLVTSGLQDL
jgi:hypothetical protein